MRVIVAGATGLIGRAVVKLLQERPGVETTALVRRPSGITGERVFDFASEAAYATLEADVVICAVGTTIKAAGSQKAFRAVDHDIPVRLIQRLAASGHGVLGLVSSVGAERPMGFYLTVKAEVEKAVAAAGISAVIARPSLLTGREPTARVGEAVIAALAEPLFALLRPLAAQIPAVSVYGPIAAKVVAAALVNTTLALAANPPTKPEIRFLEGEELRNAAV